MIYKNRFILCMLLLLLVLSSFSGLHAQPSALSDISLGQPPVSSEPPACLLYPTAEDFPSDGLRIDPSNRNASRTFFYTYYQDALSPAHNWNGNVATCTAGATADAFKDAIMQRINYFRAMAGVPADITWSLTCTAKAQEAALMMSAQGALDHHPTESWPCYSLDGDEAASKSNLALGTYGCGAINMYMKDPGANNEAAGHRRWLLYPRTQLMGTGDIPSGPATNALWVIGNYRTTLPPNRDTFVAWPPPGYVPYQVVYPRWSFAYAGADFSQCSVSVSQNGQNVPLAVYTDKYGYGDNTIVWIMNGMSSWDSWPRPESDEVYHVTIDNVLIEGSPQIFTYSVIVMDPSQALPATGLNGWLHLLLGTD